MKQAWSFFWLVVASCIAFVIISQMIAPYIGVIAVAFVIIVALFIGAKVILNKLFGRRHF